MKMTAKGSIYYPKMVLDKKMKKRLNFHQSIMIASTLELLDIIALPRRDT